MHHVMRTPTGTYTAYTGVTLLQRLGVADAKELLEEYKEVAGAQRVQAGMFLFYALSRALSDPCDAADEDGDEPVVYRRCPGVVAVLRREQGLTGLPDDADGEPCRYCHVRAVVTLPARQTRSADEPEMYIAQCAACGRRM